MTVYLSYKKGPHTQGFHFYILSKGVGQAWFVPAEKWQRATVEACTGTGVSTVGTVFMVLKSTEVDMLLVLKVQCI